MEQQQRSLVFTAAVGLIILAIIVGSIYYLVKFIQGRVASTRQVQTQTEQQTAESSANPNQEDNGSQIIQTGSPAPANQVPQTGSNAVTDKKVFSAGDFQMAYPKSWGLLKCTNSKNIEIDPVNPADSSIACDLAVKPVTILVSDIRGCEGQASKVGSIDVVKSQVSENGYTKYQWCTKTTPVLNITHRVSQNGEQATSKQDFSRQIEDIIANLSFSRGS